MIYLILSILCATYLILLFKYFEKHRIRLLQAIAVNYGVCTVMGIGLCDRNSLLEITEKNDLLLFGIFLGSLFIITFYGISLTAQKVSITVAAVANKLSLIIPVAAGFYFYDEKIQPLKTIGILIAIAAIFCASFRKENYTPFSKGLTILLPFLVFMGSGIIDTAAKYLQAMYFQGKDFNHFFVILFGTAACIGIIIVLFRLLVMKEPLSLKNILAGIFLGVPNYGSMYFLIKALDTKGWESSVIFPINNMSVMALAALCGWILFGERLSRLNGLGLILALLAITLITLCQ